MREVMFSKQVPERGQDVAPTAAQEVVLQSRRLEAPSGRGLKTKQGPRCVPEIPLKIPQS